MREQNCDCDRCKLELWDDDSGLAENPDRPDLVIDQTSRLNLGRNKYVDSLADEDEYRHMDEKISAYRYESQTVLSMDDTTSKCF